MRNAIALVLTFSLIIAGCGAGVDSDQNDVGLAAQAMPDNDIVTIAPGGSIGDMMGGLNTEISLDPEIAGAWSGIRVEVVDSETGDAQTLDIQLGEAVALGDSGLTLSADTFIPDFVMDEGGIKSRSAETHNPAARVVISEGGAIAYEGWLFAAMPEIHPFPHDRYRVLLVEGIPSE
jgi:hypothetical protein